MHHKTVLNMAANTEFKVPLLPLTASKKPAINLPKFDFNDLILQEELGRGGFGVVYKAKHFNQTVVVKQMLHHDVHMKKLFIKEAKLSYYICLLARQIMGWCSFYLSAKSPCQFKWNI